MEGPTEETSFPRIFEKLAKPKQRRAVVFKGLLHTGDIDGRDADKLLQIYAKLSGADAPFPPAIGFILDSETRSQQQKDDLTKRSTILESPMRFLPRRMFENYLLNSAAIAAVLSSVEGFDRTVSAEQVYVWLKARKAEDRTQNNWENTVHAGNLLKALFSDLSGQTVEYRKTEHSVAIADWLLENEPPSLQEIADLVHVAMQESVNNT